MVFVECNPDKYVIERKIGFQQFIDELLKINDNEINAIIKWLSGI